ncbi:methyltransferase domain-containing protein [Paenibacillus tyrfis]|uniref:Stilbene synthase n=1 Tax=Paenibacillus tyrfis TaxID=1501230 RepID=A0A081NXH3_9BACL|nr:methyltransferase domain-containing protein [Paenibacillus tyrfis]KEQ23146.1 stilbene synthase [Paenibacillus tyrfis]
MFNRLKHRTAEPELMDDLSIGGPELREALRHLRRLNRIFHAALPILYGVSQLWIQANKPKSFSILDVGCGSGDVNRRLLKWADSNRIDLAITLVDITEEACEEAKRIFYHEPRVQVMRGNLFELPEKTADIVTGTQFLHHFTDGELPQTVSSMLKASRWGIVINDIHRNWIPWVAVWLTSRIVSRNRYIRHDGPLSVAKGFQSSDWQHLRQSLGITRFTYSWIPLFRYAVVIGKDRL